LLARGVNDKEGYVKMKLTPIKAIRKKCIDCACGDYEEIRLCACTDCPLYNYRMGHRPDESEDTEE